MAINSIVRTPHQLGVALRMRRRALDLSQADVAGRIGARQATISTVESGGADTRLSTLMDLLAALDLELVVRPRDTSGRPQIEDIF